MRVPRVLTVLVSLFILSCSGGDDGKKSDSGPPATDGAAGASLVGTFQVSVVGPDTSAGTTGSTTVFGKVYDGPTPSAEIWEEAATDGACKLLKPRIPFCETPCGGSAICVDDGKCQSYPKEVTVGTVHLEGVHTESGETKISMDPVAQNYQPVGVTLSYPPFSEGDEIKLTADGEPKLTATAKGISPLVLESAPLQLETGKSATLTWTAPKQSGLARIKVKLDISHHGGTKGKIECDTDDSGSLELTATLLDQLQALGVAGFPTVAVTRETSGSAPAEVGKVDLVINSRVEQEVVIPGLVSCNDDSDCPSGQTCQTDLRCK